MELKSGGEAEAGRRAPRPLLICQSADLRVCARRLCRDRPVSLRNSETRCRVPATEPPFSSDPPPLLFTACLIEWLFRSLTMARSVRGANKRTAQNGEGARNTWNKTSATRWGDAKLISALGGFRVGSPAARNRQVTSRFATPRRRVRPATSRRLHRKVKKSRQILSLISDPSAR